MSLSSFKRFDSILVRLKGTFTKVDNDTYTCFDSILVRLKGHPLRIPMHKSAVSIPYWFD